MTNILTKEQHRVVDKRISIGYQVIGIFNSKVVSGVTVGLVKGRHRMQINCLGYDEYTGNSSCFFMREGCE